jgi:hypothetical protein
MLKNQNIVAGRRGAVKDTGLVILALLMPGCPKVYGCPYSKEAQDKKQDVNLNVGGLTNQSFTGPIFTLGAGADIHLGKHVMISPEFQTENLLCRWGCKYSYHPYFNQNGCIWSYQRKNKCRPKNQ